MANNFNDIQVGANQLLDNINLKIKEVDDSVKILNTNVTKLFSGGVGSSNATTQKIKTLESEITKLNSAMMQQESQIKRLANVRAQSNKATSQEVVNQRALKRASDLEAQSKSKIVGAYAKLIARQKQAKKILQDLIIVKGKDNALTIKAQKNYDRLSSQINKANKATSNFAKGGLGRAVSGFKNLLGAFGIVGGLSVIRDLTKNVFNLAKQFDAFRFTMQKTIGDAVELGQTQEFLDEITQNYGTNLITTTERYIKFDAAARQSNISLAETQRIFGTVTKAAGVLGLKTDELSGVYLALEQMLSKGKVTTEELRRQLGERLPGAFGIMADAIGVSTSKLDKMLKAGEILSKDALPKFAIQLEKAYGIEAVEKIDTLQAAQTRLSNAWSMFVRDISGDDTIIQTTFKGVLSFMSGLLEGIKDIGSEIKEAFTSEAVKEFEKSQNRFADKQKEQVEKLNSFKDATVRINAALTQRFALEESLAKRMEENGKFVSNGIEYSVSAEQAAKSTRELVKEIEDFNGSGADAQKFIDSLSRQYLGLSDNVIATTFARIKGIDSVIKKTQEQIEAEEEAIETTEKKLKQEKEVINGATNSEIAFGKQISALQKLKSETEVGSAKWNFYDKMIGLLQFSLKGLTGGLKESKDELGELASEFPDLQAHMEEAIETIDALRESSKDFFKTFQEDFFSQAGFDFLGEVLLDFDAFEEAIDNSEVKWAAWATSIMEVGQEAFNFLNQNQDAYFENQLYRLEQERDIALQFAGDSASGREEIERQYEERRREIQQKQAQAEKETAMFNIAIDIAQGILATIANVGFPAAIPLVAAIGAIGAAQLAIVASTPVPEFFRGTSNAPEGWAKVDEKRPEIHTDRAGNIKSTGEGKANHRWLSAGDKIYSSHEEYFKKELGGVLEGNDILPYREMLRTSTPVVNINGGGIKKADFVKEIRAMRSEIVNKESSVVNIDKNGFYTGVRKKGSETNRQNNILKMRGGIV